MDPFFQKLKAKLQFDPDLFKKCKNKEGKRKDNIFFIYLLLFNWQFKKID